MLKGPTIKLAVDLNRMSRFFPLDMHLIEGFDYDWIIDREKYGKIARWLKAHKIENDVITREFCFILLWIEKETQAGEEKSNFKGKFYRMQAELDALNDYLLQHRIVSVILKGEPGKNIPGEDFVLEDEISIDRFCDAIRKEFRNEFDRDKEKRRIKGLAAWQRRKMERIRNKMLNYMASAHGLDELSLEEQNDLIDRIVGLAGVGVSPD
jgi:hypothetical protein